MKKLVTIMLVLVMVFGATSAFADSHNTPDIQKGDFVLKGGVDVGGNIIADDASFNVDESVKTGFSLIGEYIVPQNENFSYGAGVEFPVGGREADATNADSFSFVPFYGLARYTAENNLFLTGKLGYNTFSIDDMPPEVDVNGGMYYGIGAGMKVKDNLEVEALYSSSNGNLELTYNGTETANITYSRFTLSIGASF